MAAFPPRHRVCTRAPGARNAGRARSDCNGGSVMSVRRWAALALVLAGVLTLLFGQGGGAAEPARKVGPSQKDWDKAVDRGIDYLRKSQADDGSWGKQPRGITGLAVTG